MRTERIQANPGSGVIPGKSLEAVEQHTSMHCCTMQTLCGTVPHCRSKAVQALMDNTNKHWHVLAT
jgi:hypothetical protein